MRRFRFPVLRETLAELEVEAEDRTAAILKAAEMLRNGEVDHGLVNTRAPQFEIAYSWIAEVTGTQASIPPRTRR